MTPNIMQMKQLEKVYRLANKEEIIGFLARHPGLMETLLEAEKPIRKHFGEAVLELLFTVDEEDTDWESVFIKVKHGYAWNEVRQKRLALLGDWFTHLPNAQKKLIYLLTEQL